MTDVLKAAALNAAVQIVDVASIPERKDRVRQVATTAVALMATLEVVLARHEETVAAQKSESVAA